MSLRGTHLASSLMLAGIIVSLCGSVRSPLPPLPANLTNVALHKQTWQSTTYTAPNGNNGYSWKAVDGNANTDYNAGWSCIATTSDSGPWWVVDLGAMYDVNRVDITNRQDAGAAAWLHDIAILVGDQFDATVGFIRGGWVCAVLYRPWAVTMQIQCDRMIIGRYVKLSAAMTMAGMNICEVAVYALPHPKIGF